MKSLTLLFVLFATLATAQQFFLTIVPPLEPLPQTRSWVDADGKVLGTATFHDGRVYLRDPKGKHVATVIPTPARDGVIYLDESGKVIDGRNEPVNWAK